MISGAGIDSGIPASREKIALRDANPREERLPMLKALPVSVALVLAAVLAAGAAGPDLTSEDQKTLYALGLVISQNLSSFNLSQTELDAVLAGVSDGVLKKEFKVDMKGYGPKITALQTARARAAAAVEKKMGQTDLDKGAAGKRGTKTASGLVITTLHTR